MRQLSEVKKMIFGDKGWSLFEANMTFKNGSLDVSAKTESKVDEVFEEEFGKKYIKAQKDFINKINNAMNEYADKIAEMIQGLEGVKLKASVGVPKEMLKMYDMAEALGLGDVFMKMLEEENGEELEYEEE